jgi:hypothetical protein
VVPRETLALVPAIRRGIGARFFGGKEVKFMNLEIKEIKADPNTEYKQPRPPLRYRRGILITAP